MSVLDQLVSQIPGLHGFNAQEDRTRQANAQVGQQAAQFMTLQGAMEDRAAKRAGLEREAVYRQRFAAAKTDEERAQIAAEGVGPQGYLQHADKVSRDRATSEQAKSRMMLQAQQFMETKRLRQAEIDRMTNNDTKRDAQRSLDNEATAFRLQLSAEAARQSGALGADTIFGFQPRPVPTVPTMQAPGGAPAAGTVTAPASPLAAAVTQVRGSPVPSASPAAFPRETPAARVGAMDGRIAALERELAAQGENPDPELVTELARAKGGQGTLPPNDSAPMPAQAPAAPNNLDARDLGAGARGPVIPPSTSQAPATVITPPSTVITPQAQGAPVARGVEPVMPQFSGTPRERARAENQWRLQQSKPSVAGTGGLTDDALTLAADQFLAGDSTAVQGYARDQKTRQALQNRIAERARENGMGGKEVAAAVAEFQGFKSGQRAVGTRQAQIEMAGNVTQEFVPLALEASAAFDRTDYKTLNDVQKAIQSRTASPELRAFNFANNALINSYARAINPNGVGTVSDKDHAREILDTGFSKGDYTAAVRQLEKEIGAELKAPGSVKREMRKFFGAKAADGGAATPVAPPNAESAVKAAGYAYEPDKYEYRVGIGGQVQRKAK